MWAELKPKLMIPPAPVVEGDAEPERTRQDLIELIDGAAFIFADRPLPIEPRLRSC